MNLIKITIPTSLLIISTVSVYVFFTHIPVAIQQSLLILPYVLCAAAVLMAMYFNLSGLFYFSLIGFFNWVMLGQIDPSNALPLNLLFTCSMCLILIQGVLSEKGLFTYAAWLSHLITVLIIAISYGVWKKHPAAIESLTQFNLFPITWFAWTSLGQVTWLVVIFSWLAVLILLVVYKKQQAYYALITSLALLMLFLCHDDPLALSLTCSAGCLALLFSALQKSWHLAYIDELTALPGRRALEERLQRSLGIYALAMIDIDHFKKFNDNYGHDVGDDVLRMIAHKIGKVGGGGKAYRYGGEEFTVVFNNHSADEIKTHLNDLIQTVADTPFVVNRRKNQKPKSVQVTISIGLTDSIHKSSSDQTVKVADQALYQAKKKGRNRLQIKK